MANVLRESASSGKMVTLAEEIRRSPRVRSLLSGLDRFERSGAITSVYQKWQGAHWVLSALADLGYPEGDRKLVPIRDRILGCWLAPVYFREFEAKAKPDAYKGEGVPFMRGRYRRCASQQGNALYFLAKLGLEDGRLETLVERLLHWQWPDGGWNCDKDPRADSSSFMESCLPMLGLHLYARSHKDRAAARAAERAREVFLNRHLFRRVADGSIIHPEFVVLHYPLYWHYDILGGLKAMVAVGGIGDPRCSAALDLLERKRLTDGGWPAERRYYRVDAATVNPHADYVDWGGTSSRRMNEWVTADALSVLAASGRLEE
jgi:hypothetical protein